MDEIVYLISVNIYLVGFYLLYLFLLKNETFHLLNRIYLLSSILFSIIVPLLQFKFLQNESLMNAMAIKFSFIIDPIGFEYLKENINLKGLYVFYFFYFFIVALYLLKFLVRFVNSNELFNNPDYFEVPFSFFNRINIIENEENRIPYQHEMVHVRHKHSIDIVFLEIVGAFFWINPILNLYKNDLKKVHEFAADDYCSKLFGGNKAYATYLLQNYLKMPENLLLNFFNDHKTLKTRVGMLAKTPSDKIVIFRFLFIIPLFLLFISLTNVLNSQKRVLTYQIKYKEKVEINDTLYENYGKRLTLKNLPNTQSEFLY